MLGLPSNDDIGRIGGAPNADDGQLYYQFEHGNKDGSEKVIVRVKPSPRSRSPAQKQDETKG